MTIDTDWITDEMFEEELYDLLSGITADIFVMERGLYAQVAKSMEAEVIDRLVKKRDDAILEHQLAWREAP